VGFCLPNTNGEMVSALGSMDTAREGKREHKFEVVDSKHYVTSRAIRSFSTDAPQEER
jgi:hypothetical protein